MVLDVTLNFVCQIYVYARAWKADKINFYWIKKCEIILKIRKTDIKYWWLMETYRIRPFINYIHLMFWAFISNKFLSDYQHNKTETQLFNFAWCADHRILCAHSTAHSNNIDIRFAWSVAIVKLMEKCAIHLNSNWPL